MSFSLAIRTEAEADIAEAYAYYESIRPGLSADFLLCLEEVFSRVTRNPKQFQLIYKSVSRAFLRRFPLCRVFCGA
jgi:toxin ParE1/3/4